MWLERGPCLHQEQNAVGCQVPYYSEKRTRLSILGTSENPELGRPLKRIELAIIF